MQFHAFPKVIYSITKRMLKEEEYQLMKNDIRKNIEKLKITKLNEISIIERLRKLVIYRFGKSTIQVTFQYYRQILMI